MRSLKEIFDEVIGPIFEEEKNVKRLVGELYGFKINFINKNKGISTFTPVCGYSI